jgi:hypothetical protein
METPLASECGFRRQSSLLEERYAKLIMFQFLAQAYTISPHLIVYFTSDFLVILIMFNEGIVRI